jgi:hypothetical protein
MRAGRVTGNKPLGAALDRLNVHLLNSEELVGRCGVGVVWRT